MTVTKLSTFRQTIRWSDVECIDQMDIESFEGIVLLCKPSHTPFSLGRIIRKKLMGWDEMFANAHNSEGASLADDAIKQFKKYSERRG